MSKHVFIIKMSMDIEAHKLKQIQHIKLHTPIVSIASCPQYFAVGCLDDSLRIWPSKMPPIAKQPYLTHTQSLTSICDIAFTQTSTHIASLSLDSIIRIFELDTKNVKIIQAPMFSAFRIVFVGDTLVTCGDVGKVCYYDLVSREIIRKAEIGQTAILAIGVDIRNRKIVIGNSNGDAHILGVQKKQDTISFRPHFKTIRSIFVSKSSQTAFTSSDDCTIVSTDLSTLKTSQTFSGHTQRINSIKPHHSSPNIFFSCSSDKTVKIWDIRTNHAVHSHNMANSLWALQVIGKSLVVGGESGILQVLNID